MTARDCDRACGCRAEVERLKCEVLSLHDAAAELRDVLNDAREVALRAEGKVAKMRPVYEAARQWYCETDDDSDLFDACQAAFAADRDREGEE